MVNPQVSLSFKKLPQGELTSFVNNVVQRMTENAAFVALKPQVDELKAKLDAFNIALSNAALGGKDRTADKNDCLVAMINQLTVVARLIEIMPNLSERGIIDAGFEVRNTTRTPKTIRDLETPTGLATKRIDKSGAIKLEWSPVENAINYAIEYKKKEDETWKNGSYNNRPEYSFTNLEPDTFYDFKVKTLGPDGFTSDWSIPVSGKTY
jgi:hypothetical protein